MIPKDVDPTTAPTSDAARLLARLEDIGLNRRDDPLGFEMDLADDHGWTLGHAREIVAQYQRFLVLAHVAGADVLAPPDVDAAWRLHVTRLAHYQRTCDAMFGGFLHRPREGIQASPRARRRRVEATQAAYRRAFGDPAPAAVWTDEGQASAARARRRARSVPTWMPPPLLQARGRLGLAVLATVAASVGASAATGLPVLLAQLPIHAFFGVGGLLTLPMAVAAFTSQDGLWDLPRAGALDASEVAWLRGGAPRMAMTGIVGLIERGVLRARDGSTAPNLLSVDLSQDTRPRDRVEAACLGAAEGATLRAEDAVAATRALGQACEQRLVAAGLVAPRGAMPRRRLGLLIAFAACLAVCGARLLGGDVDAIGFGLLVGVVLLHAMLVLRLAQRPARIRWHARRQIQHLASVRHRRRREAEAAMALSASASPGGVPPASGAALAADVALVGMEALAGNARFAGLGEQLAALDRAARHAWLQPGGGADDPGGVSLLPIPDSSFG